MQNKLRNNDVDGGLETIREQYVNQLGPVARIAIR